MRKSQMGRVQALGLANARAETRQSLLQALKVDVCE